MPDDRFHSSLRGVHNKVDCVIKLHGCRELRRFCLFSLSFSAQLKLSNVAPPIRSSLLIALPNVWCILLWKFIVEAQMDTYCSWWIIFADFYPILGNDSFDVKVTLITNKVMIQLNRIKLKIEININFAKHLDIWNNQLVWWLIF